MYRSDHEQGNEAESAPFNGAFCELVPQMAYRRREPDCDIVHFVTAAHAGAGQTAHHRHPEGSGGLTIVARERKHGRGPLWAWTGGGVLVAGVVAIIISSIVNSQGPTSTPPAISKPPASVSTPPTEEPSDVVDPSAADRGWVPQPITTDADTYIRGALEAAATFDTQLSDRDAWLIYLDTWFTPDTRYTSESDQREAMATAQLELRQSIVLPENDWTSLANEKGRVSANVNGEIDYVPVLEDPTGRMKIGTADVVLTFTRVDGDGIEHAYDEQVRVSVQVLCGGESVPTPNSDQQPGDCKVVRYFPEPMEP